LRAAAGSGALLVACCLGLTPRPTPHITRHAPHRRPSQNLRFAVGHDEYAYRMLTHNAVPLAGIPEALAIVRLHSCYPWHKGGAYA
jgi:hypothetical protein